MNSKSNKKVRPGVALLVVLFVVMAITILSLGFVSRSDVELACGQNMLMRTQMDYLAESGLEHARGLILNPQDVSSEYFTGASVQQLVVDSRDYYDIQVVRDDSDPTDRCNYIIDCNSYRMEGGEKTGRSDIRARLRIDPCIAYWVGSNTTISPQVTINGDVYCTGDLTNNGVINGDVFATGTITGASIEGQKETVTQAPVAWPSLISTGYPTYYIDSTPYLAEPNIPTIPFSPSPNNPAGICYCVGDVNMPGGVTINGTLVVTGSLTISGTNTITAVKNFPALLVGGQVMMKNGSSLTVNGLAQVEQQITVDPNTTNANINVTGGLFIHSGGITSNVISVNVTAAPAIASIQTWPAPGVASRWKLAAGAFFRSIERR